MMASTEWLDSPSSSSVAGIGMGLGIGSVGTTSTSSVPFPSVHAIVPSSHNSHKTTNATAAIDDAAIHNSDVEDDTFSFDVFENSEELIDIYDMTLDDDVPLEAVLPKTTTTTTTTMAHAEEEEHGYAVGYGISVDENDINNEDDELGGGGVLFKPIISSNNNDDDELQAFLPAVSASASAPSLELALPPAPTLIRKPAITTTTTTTTTTAPGVNNTIKSRNKKRGRDPGDVVTADGSSSYSSATNNAAAAAAAAAATTTTSYESSSLSLSKKMRLKTKTISTRESFSSSPPKTMTANNTVMRGVVSPTQQATKATTTAAVITTAGKNSVPLSLPTLVSFSKKQEHNTAYTSTNRIKALLAGGHHCWAMMAAHNTSTLAPATTTTLGGASAPVFTTTASDAGLAADATTTTTSGMRGIISKRNLTPSEYAKQHRDRNREHARGTRLRKKAYLEELKRTLSGLLNDRDTTVLSRQRSMQREMGQREVRFKVIKEFLSMRGKNEPNAKRWCAILENPNEFVLVLPITKYRKMVQHCYYHDRGAGGGDGKDGINSGSTSKKKQQQYKLKQNEYKLKQNDIIVLDKDDDNGDNGNNSNGNNSVIEVVDKNTSIVKEQHYNHHKKQQQQTLTGIKELLEDTNHFALFLQSCANNNNNGGGGGGSTSHNNNKRTAHKNAVHFMYNCDRRHFFMDGSDAILDWTASTMGAIGKNQDCDDHHHRRSQQYQHGDKAVPKELSLRGSLRAKFCPISNKLTSVKIFFDTGVVLAQLRNGYFSYDDQHQNMEDAGPTKKSKLQQQALQHRPLPGDCFHPNSVEQATNMTSKATADHYFPPMIRSSTTSHDEKEGTQEKRHNTIKEEEDEDDAVALALEAARQVDAILDSLNLPWL